MDVLDEPFGEIAAGHTCLVCRHHDAETGPIEEADGVDRPRIHRDAADALEITDVFDERAIPIQKHGARGCRHAIRLAALRTASTRIPRMHSWSSGHSRSQHGRHQTG